MPTEGPLPQGHAPAHAGDEILPVEILPQPDDESCGPTCLHAVYRHWGESLSLKEVMASTSSLTSHGAGSGTLAVMLGVDALRRGYRARLETFNLNVFDPTWFDRSGKSDPERLIQKLRAQADARSTTEPRFRIATNAYLEFLELGGTIGFPELSSRFIAGAIRRGVPILTGLSATYLYRCSRDDPMDASTDDIRGEPEGHFVILHGYSPSRRQVLVADPLSRNPGFETQYYNVSMARLVPAIVLGVLTYDANLLLIEPAPTPDSERSA